MALGFDGSIRIDTKLNSTGFNRGISSMIGSFKRMAGAIGVALSVAAIVSFGKESVKAASQLSSALIGLQSIVEGQGRSFDKAKSFIDDYIKDGLIPLQSAVTAYKNLSMRGYDTDQIENTMTRLKDSATFGRQASLTMGQAVESATEGLKNENSILVDNAGVTKNVSIMWKEYADKLGVGVQSLTKAQKIQAEVNGIMQETRFQTGDAAKAVNTYAGQVSMLSFNFQRMKVAVGNALIPLVQAVLPSVNVLVSSFTNLANIVAQVTTALFGGKAVEDQAKAEDDLANAGADAAGSTGDLADATEGMGDASQSAGKKLKGVLAGFDDLNLLATKASDSVGDVTDGLGDGLNVDNMGGGTLFGDVTVSPEILNFVERLKEELRIVGEYATRIGELFQELGSSFAAVWQNGTGEKMLNTILNILKNVVNYYATLADKIREAWEANGNGIAIWQSILNIIQSILDYSNRVSASWVQWASNLNLEPIVSSFRNFLAALQPLVDLILDGLFWAYESVLQPLAKWVIEEAAPAGLDLLSAAIEALTAVLEALKPFGLWLWESLLEPLAKWTGELFIAAIKGITGALNAFAAWARDNPETIQTMAKIILSFLAGLVMYHTVQKITAVIGAIRLALEGLAKGFSLAQVQAGLAVIAFGAVAYAIISLMQSWGDMNGAEKFVSILGAIIAVALAAALAVGAFQSSLTMGLAAAGIVAGIALIIGSINQAKARAEEAMRKMNSAGSYGGASAGGPMAFSLPTSYDVPHLANGAVIPPNQQFLAMLGDQRGGTNIEAPLATIEQAVENVLARRGTDGGTITVEMPVYLDNREIYRGQKTVSRLIGKSLVGGV